MRAIEVGPQSFLRNEHALVDYLHVNRVDLADGLGNGVVVSDVGDEDHHIDAGGEADRLLHLLELVGESGEDGDARALRRGLVGQGESDAVGSVGDEHMAVLDWDFDWARAD
nr:hypothetical protein CFP56_65691 [Quercus suber]